ncbi:MAG: hypothetical protein NZV14_06860 [Bryobacteraceae bacterium]|nr:hypothetical protein [Bryobacteraceae bacterium]MDW8377862.1 hypothetical protein [Bryobacterales bacterium]
MLDPHRADGGRTSFLLLYPPALSPLAENLLRQLSYCGLRQEVAGYALEGASLRAGARQALESASHALLLFAPNAAPSPAQLRQAFELESQRRDALRLFPVLVDGAQVPALRRAGALEFRTRALRLASQNLLAGLPALVDRLIPGWTRAHFFSRYWLLDQLFEARQLRQAVELARSLCDRACAAGSFAYDQAMVDIPMARILLARALFKTGERQEPEQLLRLARNELLGVLGRQGQNEAPPRQILWLEIADAMLDMKMTAEARWVLEEAAEAALSEHDPLHAAIAQGQLAQIFLSEKQFAQALGLCEQVRDAFTALNHPRLLARAWRQLGQIHREASQLAAAEQAFLEASRLDPDPELLATLAELCAQQKRLREAAVYAQQQAGLFQMRGDRAAECEARLTASRYFARAGAVAQARAELAAAEDAQSALQPVAEPWKLLDARRELELSLGNFEAADQAKRQAMETFLAFRRTRGENDFPSGQIANFVVLALAAGSTTLASKQLEEWRRNPDLPAHAKIYLEVIGQVLAGSRDRTLAHHPDLTFDEAAEIHVLMDALHDS